VLAGPDPFGRAPGLRFTHREGRVSALADLIDDVAAGRDPDGATLKWLAAGLEAWLLSARSTRAARLEGFLGLAPGPRGQGGRAQALYAGHLRYLRAQTGVSSQCVDDSGTVAAPEHEDES
jgi:hypothetical protein